MAFLFALFGLAISWPLVIVCLVVGLIAALCLGAFSRDGHVSWIINGD